MATHQFMPDPKIPVQHNPSSKAEEANVYNSPQFQQYLKQQRISPPFDLNSSNAAERKLAEKWYKERADQFIEDGGLPSRPEFQSMIDPSTGQLKKELQLNPGSIDPNSLGQLGFDSAMPGMEQRLSSMNVNKIDPNAVGDLGFDSALGDIKDRFGGVNLNKDALNALRTEGSRTGPSAWAELMKKNIKGNELDALDKVGGQALGANATALSNLAMNGGLQSGARTSLAKNLQRDINSNSQQIRRGSWQDMLNVDLQDESKRMDVLKSLPGMELASLQPDMQKAQSLNEAQLLEQARGMDASKFNLGMDADAQKYNTDLLNQLEKYKTDTLNSTAMTEQARGLDADKYNLDSALNVNKYNVDNQNSAQKFNVQAALNEKLQERGFDLNSYNEAMKMFAADKQGEAMAGGGKK